MAEVRDESLQRTKSAQWRSFRRGVLYFFLACAALWIVFYTILIEFPYLQPGSDIVTAAKRSYSLTHPLFDPDTKIRILVFGNSKTLAGFNPTIFDAGLKQAGVVDKVQSVNEAMPGDRRFVVYLDQLLQTGVRPTHVLVQFTPVAEDHETTFGEWIRHDKKIVDTLFPFRTLPRDFTLFVFSAAGHGGMRAFYRESADIAQQVMRDHGYYFLKGQSHYAGNRLPDDYVSPTDTPEKYWPRTIETELPASVRLEELSKRYGFKIIFFPPVYRVGELAAAPPRDAVETMKEWPNGYFVGDDYWLMPNADFSDPVHLNPDGAEIYTKRLAALFAPVLQQDGR